MYGSKNFFKLKKKMFKKKRLQINLIFVNFMISEKKDWIYGIEYILNFIKLYFGVIYLGN